MKINTGALNTAGYTYLIKVFAGLAIHVSKSTSIGVNINIFFLSLKYTNAVMTRIIPQT